ncbi:hypothetical protein D187_008423 [Cystobacter fuscus DSM 2262]|uniref:Uncharacterized protein n=1 Tax=Cystobacter fuscus (strain ATCC 25194 / DSM 2262 / NBRC 100088 / M29) TaxID=1242864 RepID=S9PGN6_CYSF2|nr:hypothetical protein D187_008423 [Cystobacter fuscus DSM 2262]
MAKPFVTPSNPIDFPNEKRRQSTLNPQWTISLTDFTHPV